MDGWGVEPGRQMHNRVLFLLSSDLTDTGIRSVSGRVVGLGGRNAASGRLKFRKECYGNGYLPLTLPCHSVTEVTVV